MESLEPLLELDLSPVHKKMARPKMPPSVDANPLQPKSRRLPADVRRARHRDRMQRQRLAEKQSIELKRVEEEDEEFKLLEGDTGWKGRSTAARLIQQRYLSLVLQQGSITEENRRLTERFRA
ncbi:hypothetical protein PF001_g24651 [Phytophthora fragariae]|uniref:Uncharacterized protein n=1 Tax=Phytophthora fragariae TaxID=53985 RepID=A0A6A4BSH3_9STRA|nr:hypothetical protein PF001_g24651 [Phytophthora fragariae]